MWISISVERHVMTHSIFCNIPAQTNRVETEGCCPRAFWMVDGAQTYRLGSLLTATCSSVYRAACHMYPFLSASTQPCCLCCHYVFLKKVSWYGETGVLNRGGIIFEPPAIPKAN